MFEKRKIDFLIIGAQKSGTTSLYEYLTSHLLIDSARKKEVHFFNDNYNKGVNWYHERFNFNNSHLQGECTPYYLFGNECAGRAHEYNRKLKILAILRNPVERAFSQYRMNVERNMEPLSFMEALEREEERTNEHIEMPYGNSLGVYSYKARGLYAKQLNNWLQYFEKDQLMVLEYDNFFQDPWHNVQKVYRFLGLPDYYGCTQLFSSNKNVGNMEMPKDAENYLRHYFAEPNQILAEKFNVHF